MVDSPSPPSHNDLIRSSRSRSPSTSSRSSAVRNGTSHHGSTKEYSSSSGGRSSKGYAAKEVLKIVQVANIAPQATREQMQALFGYVGKIDDIRLYPTVDIGLQLQSKICFVKFYDSTSVGSAQHLTNTVFIDRALIVIPYLDGDIPDETRALELLASGSLLPGIADPKLPQHVTSQLEGIPPLQVVATKDPRLVERNLPLYPPLPPTVDQRKIEEIRRTIMVCNISSEVTAQDVMDFFGKAGEVKYFRFCTRDNDPLKFALIEFSEQPSILLALQFNGQYIGDKMIRVYHATQAIIKPQAKTNEAAQKEIEEAMSRQAQNLLTHGLDTTGGFNAGKYADVAPSVKDKGRRSRSRSRSHSRRSRSRGRRRSRSRSRRRSSRSRSRRSSSRHRDRYRTKAVKSRSRSRDRRRSRDSKKRSRSRGRSRKSRSRSHSRRSRSRSRKRDDKKKSKKDKDRDKDKERDKERSSKDHKENGEEIDLPPKESRQKKSDRRSRSPKTESKKRRRSRSHSRKIRSSPIHEKSKRSKSKKKKKDNSDREASVDSLIGHSRSSSQEKRSKKESSGDLDYDDKSDISRSHGDMDMTEA